MGTITKTIGTGADYTTIAAWAADLDNASIYASGDIAIGQLSENKAYSVASVSLTQGVTIGLSKRVLTAASGVRHTGIKGTGARIVATGNAPSTTTPLVGHGTSINTEISWIEIDGGGFNWNILLGCTGDNTARTNSYHHNIIHRNGNPTTGNIIGIDPKKCSHDTHNNQIFGLSDAATGGANIYAILTAPTAPTTTERIYNNTIHGLVNTSGTGEAVGLSLQSDNALKFVRNNVITGPSGTSSGSKLCFKGTYSTGTYSHNASSDATAPGTSSLINRSTATEYRDTSTDDYRLASGATLYQTGVDLGTTPDNVQFDLAGRDRDTLNDTWSIGAGQTTNAATNALTLTSPTAFRIYQRDGAGEASMTLIGSYSGTPTSIEVRTNGGAWSTLVASPSGGTFSSAITLPGGTHSLDVRFANSTGTTASVSNVLVGDVFVVAGQSNAEGRGTSAQTYTHATQKAALFKEGAMGWAELIDPTDADTTLGSAWPRLATEFMADQSVPIGFITTAEGGTSLFGGDWNPTGTPGPKLTNCISTITASGVNSVKAVLWHQGESDAVAGVSQANYKTALDALAVYFAANVPGAPALLSAQIGPYTTVAAASLDAIRLAQSSAWGDASGVKAGPVCYDIATDDGVHFKSDVKLLLLARRWWAAIDDVIFDGTQGRGTRVVSAVFNDTRNQITVGFDLDIKTGLTFSAAAWSVSDANGTVTVSSVAYHGTDPKKLVLTLGAAAVGTSSVTFGSGNSAAGVVVPLGPDVAVTGTTINLPAEPFAAFAVSEVVSVGAVSYLEITQQGENTPLTTDSLTAGQSQIYEVRAFDEEGNELTLAAAALLTVSAQGGAARRVIEM
ncbi:MAG TPA: sialate O-acetylesterase [Abditibacterium sp.]|jgi:hypothetical protein